MMDRDDPLYVPPERRLTLTVEAAAAVAGLPVKQVRAAVDRGDLPHFTLGSTTVRIRRSDLEQWVSVL